MDPEIPNSFSVLISNFMKNNLKFHGEQNGIMISILLCHAPSQPSLAGVGYSACEGGSFFALFNLRQGVYTFSHPHTYLVKDH